MAASSVPTEVVVVVTEAVEGVSARVTETGDVVGEMATSMLAMRLHSLRCPELRKLRHTLSK